MVNSPSQRILVSAAVMASIVVVVFSTALVHTQAPEQNDRSEKLPGKSLYEARCAMCHGTDGKGSGVAAPFLHPRPRDFSSGKYKFRTTESGSIPTDADLERTIREGLHGSAMPDWKDFLAGDSLSAVISYIKSFSPRFRIERPAIVRLGTPVSSSPAGIEAGKKLYFQLQCSSCHGTDGQGKDAEAGDFVDDLGNDVSATNLTEPWTFRGGSTANDIYLRIRTGIDGSPMPSYIGSAGEKELWNLANFVVSLGRKPIWSMNEAEVQRHFDQLAQQTKKDPVKRGQYWVRVLGCMGCHSPFDAKGQLIEQLRFAGGMKWSLGPYGYVTTTNLTSDKETGLGEWTDEEIKRGINRGIRRDGSRSIPFPMPWTSFANLNDDDLSAIVAYLRTIPPLNNRIPEPESLNIFSYLWGKFKMLILGEDFAALMYPGNAGATRESGQ